MSARTPGGRSGAALDLRRVFRDLPQPVVVVTGRTSSGSPVGMTVSSLTSASLAPPLVAFFPAVTSRAWTAVRERGSFAINVLGHEHTELATQFAGPGDRFAGVRTTSTEGGPPVLTDALAFLLCDVYQEHPAGDHILVLGHVRAVETHRGGRGLDTQSLRAGRTRRRGCAGRPVPVGDGQEGGARIEAT